MMKNFLADLRFGLRMLRKSPGFAFTTIAVLALGIGANAAVFSVVDAVLLADFAQIDEEMLVPPAPGGIRWIALEAGRLRARAYDVDVLDALAPASVNRVEQGQSQSGDG